MNKGSRQVTQTIHHQTYTHAKVMWPVQKLLWHACTGLVYMKYMLSDVILSVDMLRGTEIAKLIVYLNYSSKLYVP
jgi:hypothetical protein